MKVGIVGCGVISKNYAENAPAFDFELAACADLEPRSPRRSPPITGSKRSR